MPDLVVIVPSRGRPEAARALVQQFRSTCTAKTFLVFAVDDDDPTKPEYATIGDGITAGVVFTPSKTMVESLNITAKYFVAAGDVRAIGFLGDDHRPRTHGWDQLYLDALADLGTGIVYGDDLLQGENLPTECAMTADIIAALGYMAPPGLRHLFVDNTWLVWGRTLDRIRYLPDVIVEHMHPVAGKAEWSEGHQRVNSAEINQHDQTAFTSYLHAGLAEDIRKIREVMR